MRIYGAKVIATVSNVGNDTLRAALTVYVDGKVTRVRRIEVAPGEKTDYTFELGLAEGEYEIKVAVAGKQKGEIVTITDGSDVPTATLVSKDGSTVLELNIPKGATGRLLITLYQDGKEMSQQTLELSAGNQFVSLDNLLPGIYQANVRLLADDGSVLYEETIELEKPITDRSLTDSVELNSVLAAIWLLVMALGLVRILEV